MQTTTGTFSFEPFYFVLDKSGTPIAGVQKGLFSDEDTQTILEVICRGLEKDNFIFGNNAISVGLPFLYKDLSYYSQIGDSTITSYGLVKPDKFSGIYGVSIDNLFNLNESLKGLSKRSSDKFFKGSVVYIDSFAHNLKTAYDITESLSIAYSFAMNYPKPIEDERLGLIQVFRSHTAGYSTLHYSYKDKGWLYIQSYDVQPYEDLTDVIFLQDLLYSIKTYSIGITYTGVPHNTKVPLGTYENILSKLTSKYSTATLFKNISYFYKISGLSTLEVFGCGRLGITKAEDYNSLVSKFVNNSDVYKYLIEVAFTHGNIDTIIDKYPLK